MGYVAPITRASAYFVDAARWNQDVVDNQNAAFPLGVGAWTAFTPTLTQLGAVTKTVTYANYQRVGRLITAAVVLTVTGTGTGANSVLVGLPVAAALSSNLAIGSGLLFDSSAALNYRAIVTLASATTVFLNPAASTVSDVLGNTSFTAALAVSDIISYTVTYESAT